MPCERVMQDSQLRRRVGGNPDPMTGDYLTYLESMAYAPSTIRARMRLLRLLGDPLTATRDDVMRVISTPVKPSARRVYLAHLRAAYQDFGWLDWTDRDPTLGVRIAKSPPPPPCPLARAQTARLLDAPRPFRDWTALGVYAGLRSSEVLALQRRDYDGERLRISGKGNKTATVPAHPRVAQVMADWTRPSYSTAGHLSAAWATAARRVGVPGVHFHQCRHTFATELLRETHDLMLVRDAMRHASVSTTQRYTVVVDDRVAAAVRALVA